MYVQFAAWTVYVYTFFPVRRCGCIAGGVLSTAERIRCNLNNGWPPNSMLWWPSPFLFFNRGGDRKKKKHNGRPHYLLRRPNATKTPSPTQCCHQPAQCKFFDQTKDAKGPELAAAADVCHYMVFIVWGALGFIKTLQPAMIFFSFFFSNTPPCGRVSHRWFGSASLCECGRAAEVHDVCSWLRACALLYGFNYRLQTQTELLFLYVVYTESLDGTTNTRGACMHACMQAGRHAHKDPLFTAFLTAGCTCQNSSLSYMFYTHVSPLISGSTAQHISYSFIVIFRFSWMALLLFTFTDVAPFASYPQ